jgi:hypothetical protein
MTNFSASLTNTHTTSRNLPTWDISLGSLTLHAAEKWGFYGFNPAILEPTYPVKTRWLLYVPDGLILKKSTLYRHSAFKWSIRILDQVAMISLHNTTGL